MSKAFIKIHADGGDDDDVRLAHQETATSWSAEALGEVLAYLDWRVGKKGGVI